VFLFSFSEEEWEPIKQAGSFMILLLIVEQMCESIGADGITMAYGHIRKYCVDSA